MAALYADGKGVPQNYDFAIELYKLAVRENNIIAAYNLALLYSKGEGTQKDPNAAAALIYKNLKAKHQLSIDQMIINSGKWGNLFRKEMQRLLKEDGLFSGEITGGFDQITLDSIKSMF